MSKKRVVISVDKEKLKELKHRWIDSGFATLSEYLEFICLIPKRNDT